MKFFRRLCHRILIVLEKLFRSAHYEPRVSVTDFLHPILRKPYDLAHFTTPGYIGGCVSIAELRDGDSADIAVYLLRPDTHDPGKMVRDLVLSGKYTGPWELPMISIPDIYAPRGGVVVYVQKEGIPRTIWFNICLR